MLAPLGSLTPVRSRHAGGQVNSCFYTETLRKNTNESKLSTTDLLVLASMKNAAKCDK